MIHGKIAWRMDIFGNLYRMYRQKMRLSKSRDFFSDAFFVHSSNWESGCWFFDEISWSLRAAKHDDFSELGCFGSETNVAYGCITTAPPATTAIWFSKTPLLHLMLCKKSSICGSRSAVSIKPWVRLKRWILRGGLWGEFFTTFVYSFCLLRNHGNFRTQHHCDTCNLQQHSFKWSEIHQLHSQVIFHSFSSNGFGDVPLQRFPLQIPWRM